MTGRILRALKASLHQPKDAIKRSTNLLAYYALDGFAPAPRCLNLYITYKCNLKCRMCWLWGDSGLKPAASELSASEVKDLLNGVRRFRPVVTVSGGEPLTRKDLLEVLEYVKQQDLRCELLTNGTLITPELAKDLVRLVNALIFSIEGPQEINDSIRGKGSFDRVTRGIKLVQEAARIQQRKIPMRINCTISSLNLQHLDELAGIAQSLDCDLSLNHLIFSDSARAQQHEEFLRDNLGLRDGAINGLANGLNELDVALLINKLHMLKEKANELKVPFYVAPFVKGDREIKTWYSSLSPVPGMRCTYPWLQLFIKPDGSVFPCEFINYPLGNILDEDVSAIWNGMKARRFRKTLKKGLFPGCVRCCKLTPWPLL